MADLSQVLASGLTSGLIRCLVLALVATGIWAEDNRSPQPHFSVERGHFSAPFVLEISAPAPGWALLVTTDGSQPSLMPLQGEKILPVDSSSAATWSKQIDQTSSIRALASGPNSEVSSVATHSYVFPQRVLKQGKPAQHSAAWGHSGPDWEVDPDIVQHKNPQNRLAVADLLSIPALYISLPFEQLWGDQGIYIAGEGEPRDCSVELLNPAGDSQAPNQLPGLQHNGTIQVTGGSSTQRWKTDKLSFRLKFHHETRFPVFAHAATVSGQPPPETFHTLVLDARLNESWTHSSSEQREHGQYTRDQFMADLENDDGGFAPHGRHVHLYLAGVYWGLYNLHERPDQHFASHYLGGEPDDYDVIKHQWDDIVSGSNERFLELRDLLDQPDVASSESFARISGLLDIEDFARYMLLNYWAGNTDWSHQNWYASFNRNDPAGRWRFHSWDAEHTLKALNENVTTKDNRNSPTHFHRRLMKNPEYQAIFSQMVHAAPKPGGMLDEELIVSGYRKRLNEIESAIRGESARWGDNRRRQPYTREGDWAEERERILRDYLPARTNVLMKQLKAERWIQ